jgi:hypothetical protein
MCQSCRPESPSGLCLCCSVKQSKLQDNLDFCLIHILYSMYVDWSQKKYIHIRQKGAENYSVIWKIWERDRLPYLGFDPVLHMPGSRHSASNLFIYK